LPKIAACSSLSSVDHLFEPLDVGFPGVLGLPPGEQATADVDTVGLGTEGLEHVSDTFCNPLHHGDVMNSEIREDSNEVPRDGAQVLVRLHQVLEHFSRIPGAMQRRAATDGSHADLGAELLVSLAQPDKGLAECLE
jgi:hypothetical protein